MSSFNTFKNNEQRLTTREIVVEAAFYLMPHNIEGRADGLVMS